MATIPRPPLSESELKTLEQTRQRLAQLTNTLSSLQNSLTHSDPLPPPKTLTTQSSILSTALAAYASHLTTASPLLTRLAAYPSATFPGREGEKVGLVQNLLRKKLGGEAEEWVEEGGRRGRGVLGAGVGMGDRSTEKGLEELWAWAGPEANRLARGYRWGVGALGEEGEEEEEEEEDEGDEDDEDGDEAEEEEDDVMEVSAPVATGAGERIGVVGIEKAIEVAEEVREPLPLEDILRFMTTGRQPEM